MSHAHPAADYSDKSFPLQHPALSATVITLVIAGVFLYLVISAGGHPPSGAHGAAAGSGSAAKVATSAKPAASAPKR